MNMDWKWIGFGVLIMFGLNILAGIAIGFILGPQLEGVTDPADVELSGGQIALAAGVNFLAFAIGGFIVGVRSAGKTILEPAVAAAIAVGIGLALTGSFTVGHLLVGGIIPFFAGLLGGWLGEKRQESKATT